MKNNGVLISFEGGEGAGKTVQITLLKDKLLELKKEVVALREPGGTMISEKIRKIVLDPEHVSLAYPTEVLLFQAARAQIYAEIVLPSLKAGKIVLMDRTRDSSVVYQGMARGFGVEVIEQLNQISTQDTYPDLTFLLDVPVDLGLKRRNGAGEINRLELERVDFHEKIREGYLTLAKNNDHNRWVTIDATKTIEAIADEVWEVVQKRVM